MIPLRRIRVWNCVGASPGLPPSGSAQAAGGETKMPERDIYAPLALGFEIRTSQGDPRRFGRKGEWRGHREGASGLFATADRQPPRTHRDGSSNPKFEQHLFT
jgi:hypothetical protein